MPISRQGMKDKSIVAILKIGDRALELSCCQNVFAELYYDLSIISAKLEGPRLIRPMSLTLEQADALKNAMRERCYLAVRAMLDVVLGDEWVSNLRRRCNKLPTYKSGPEVLGFVADLERRAVSEPLTATPLGCAIACYAAFVVQAAVLAESHVCATKG